MTLSAIGFGGMAAICFGAAILLMRKKAWPKAQPWLMLTAGLGIAGGLFGALLDKVAGALTTASSTTMQALFATGGAAGAAALAIWLGLYLYLHMKPKGHQPTRLTRWVALLYPPVLVAVGGVFLGASMTAGEVTTVIGRELGALIDELIAGAGR